MTLSGINEAFAGRGREEDPDNLVWKQGIHDDYDDNDDDNDNDDDDQVDQRPGQVAEGRRCVGAEDGEKMAREYR